MIYTTRAEKKQMADPSSGCPFKKTTNRVDEKLNNGHDIKLIWGGRECFYFVVVNVLVVNDTT